VESEQLTVDYSGFSTSLRHIEVRN